MRSLEAGVPAGPGSLTVTTAALPERGSAYAQLSRLIKQAGLMQRRSRYYAWRIAITAGVLAIG